MLSYLQTQFPITLFDLYQLLLWVFNQIIWYFQPLYAKILVLTKKKSWQVRSHSCHQWIFQLMRNMMTYIHFCILYWNTYIDCLFFVLQRDYNYNMTKSIHVAASIKCGYWKTLNTLWIILILVLFRKFHIFTHLTFLNITLPFLMKNKLNLRLNEIIHKSFYWKAMFQVYSFWSNINLFCHIENERLKVLHRKLSHQYVGIPYR
jgi:hypothetical protein